VEIGKNFLSERRWYRVSDLQFLVYQYSGDYRKSLQICLSLLRGTNRPGFKGLQFHFARHAVQLLLLLGDIDQAGTYVRRIEVMLAESPNWTLGLPHRHSWYTDANLAKAELAEARGRYREAEALYKQAEAFGEIAENDSLHWEGDYRIPIRQLQAKTNLILRQEASNKAKQGRLAEAEFDARRALLRHLKTHGKYDTLTPANLSTLAYVLVRQGRFKEAEHLYRIAIDIQKTFGINPESQKAAETLGQLAAVLNMQHRFKEAAEVYAKLDKTIEHWSVTEKQTVELNADRIYLLFLTNQLERGLAAAQALVARETARLGEKSFEAAVARGIRAIGLTRAGRDAEALAEFRFAIPLLIAAPEERDYDDTAWISARTDLGRYRRGNG
jgi:tetratricopeptide (TPR) repeat protein